MQKVAMVNCATDILKNLWPRERTDRACFSRFLQHPARKQSRSIQARGNES